MDGDSGLGYSEAHHGGYRLYAIALSLLLVGACKPTRPVTLDGPPDDGRVSTRTGQGEWNCPALVRRYPRRDDLPLLQKACDRGSGDACSTLAYLKEKAGEIQQALRLYQSVCDGKKRCIFPHIREDACQSAKELSAGINGPDAG